MDVIGILEDLIAIDSINPFTCHRIDADCKEKWKLDGNETEISNYLEKKLIEAGFKVKKQFVHRDIQGTAFYNLLGEIGKGNRSLLFYGHMDTVTAKPWLSKEQALTPKRIGREINGEQRETVVGLGSSDMKAGLAVILSALNGLIPDGYKLKVAFGVDEEFYSMGGNVLAHSSFMDDVAAIIVPEIDDGPNSLHGPNAITLGRLGRCNFVINVPGTGGHGAQAGSAEYVNAAVECAKIVARLERMQKSHVDEYKFFNSTVSDQSNARCIKGSMYVNKICAGDGTLSIPASGEISVSLSFTPHMSIQRGEELLNKMINSMVQKGELKQARISGKLCPITVEQSKRPTPHTEAYCTSENHPFVQYVKKIIDETIGFRCYNMGYSVADENVFHRVKKDIPIINVCPKGGNFHRSDEWVEVESVRQMEFLYKKIATDFTRFLSN